MSGSDYERELRDILRAEGWLVIRSAGSFIYDLVALKPKEHRIIEAKATKEKVFYTTSDKEQFDILNAYAKEGFNVYYYIRWKGERKDKWSKYQLPLEPYPVFRKEEKIYDKEKKQSKI